MQLLLDFFPVIAFVGAYWLADMRTAIAVIMVAMVIQVAITWQIKRTVNKILLGSAALVVVLGAISLLLDNDLVFKWKPTVLNWVLAIVFFLSRFASGKPVIQRLMQSTSEQAIDMQAADWHRLNLMWVGFFTLSGAANIFVAYNFSEAFWVNFKLFGLLGMTLVFVVIQAIWLNQRINESPSDKKEES